MNPLRRVALPTENLHSLYLAMFIFGTTRLTLLMT